MVQSNHLRGWIVDKQKTQTKSEQQGVFSRSRAKWYVDAVAQRTGRLTNPAEAVPVQSPHPDRVL